LAESGGGSEETIDLLARIALFSGLSTTTLQALANQAASVHLRAGSTLMREGGPGDALYALVSGRLRVFAEQPDGSQEAVGEI
jgi:CRP-like cAMP-binding protein